MPDLLLALVPRSERERVFNERWRVHPVEFMPGFLNPFYSAKHHAKAEEREREQAMQQAGLGVDASGQGGVIELSAAVAKELAAGTAGTAIPGIPPNVPPMMQLGATTTAAARYKAAYWLAIGSQIATYRASKATVQQVVDQWKSASSSMYRAAFALQMTAGVDATSNWFDYRDPADIQKIFVDAAKTPGAVLLPEVFSQLTSLSRVDTTMAAQATERSVARTASAQSWLPSMPSLPSASDYLPNPSDYLPNPSDYLPGAPDLSGIMKPLAWGGVALLGVGIAVYAFKTTPSIAALVPGSRNDLPSPEPAPEPRRMTWQDGPDAF